MRFEAFGRRVTAGLRRSLACGVGAVGMSVLGMSVLGNASSAVAATPEPAGASATAAAASVPAEAPVLLVLHGDALDGARLEALLEAELGREVVLARAPGEAAPSAVLTIAHRPAARELAVTWERGGQTLTRLVAAPSEQAAVEGDAVMLAGNLAREQVATLLPAAPEPPAPEPPEPAPSREAAEPERWRATFGVFYPLATHYGHPEVTSSFDLNLLYSRVGGIDGGQLGGVNVVGRDGAAAGAMRGLQIGFLANLVAGDARGVQLGGLFNQTSGDVEGLQLAGGANLALGRVQGIQGAFAFNRAASVKGVQVSLVNVGGDVDGLQIGLVNVARRVRGASVGIVNVADDIEGLPLAPFSVTRTGGVHPATWGGSSGYANAGLKLATRHTYTLFFGSYHRKYDLDLYGGGVAIGGSVGLGAGFRSDFDLSGTYLVAPELSFDPSRPKGYHEQLVQPRLRWLLAFRLAEHFGVFGGVAVVGNVRSELGWERVTATIGPEVFGGVEL
jgi:hypothetical protein